MDVPTYWDGGSRKASATRRAQHGPATTAWAPQATTLPSTSRHRHVPHLLLLYGQRQKRPPKRQGDLLPAHHGGGNRKRCRPPERHADRQQRRGPVQARDKRLGIRHGAVAPRLDARPAGVRPQPQLVLGRKRPHAPPGTCESYQRIYSKLLDAAGIANGASPATATPGTP